MSARTALACLSAVLVTACAPSPVPLQKQEGHVAMDDGVPLHYTRIGSGPQVILIPVGFYLEESFSRLAAPGRTLVFFDPRHRGRSGRGAMSELGIDRQMRDFERLRDALGYDRVSLIGWSGLGTEVAVYAMRYPERVDRIVQVAPTPPARSIMTQAGGDRRDDTIDRAALDALDARFDAGEFADAPDEFCRLRNELVLPGSFADARFAATVPDVCRWENEWPVNLWPYFGAHLGSLGDYDHREAMAAVRSPRLVIHGLEDGIPVEGARAWVRGFADARLLVLSPAGHFPFLEQADAFFLAVNEFLDGGWPEGALASDDPEIG